jgi:hypothetical protein
MPQPNDASLLAIKLPSKRSRITVEQARLVASTIRELCDVLPWELNVDCIEQVDVSALCSDDLEKLLDNAEYKRFLEALYACGFVTEDFTPDFSLEAANAKPEDTLGECGLPRIRHYLHTLARAERWADGHSSPVLHAIKAGALQLVARRLASDQSLRVPHE